MSIEALRVLSGLSWTVTLVLFWLTAYRGGSETPKFDMWVSGVLLCLSVMLVGCGIAAWIEKWQR
jgi:hypothetical protein